MTNLYRASRQWADRPDDERFSTLEEMNAACQHYREEAHDAPVTRDLRVQAVDQDIKVVGRSNLPATMTHWMFSQLASRVEAPASYLRKLPPTLAAQNLNYHLANAGDSFDGYNILVHASNGEPTDLVARAFLSERYSRIWNAQITSKLLTLPDYGWRVAPARPAHANQKDIRIANESDVLNAGEFGLSINVGDEIAPAGLYTSDHDMFVFMVNEKYRLDDGNLARGFFIENSEVGAASFRLTTFLYRFVCGNHIVWDAANVNEIAIRHVGDANTRAFHDMAVTLTKYAEASAQDDELKIQRSKTFRLAGNVDELVDLIVKKKLMNEKSVRAAHLLAAQHESVDGNPLSAFGFVQGVTRLSQEMPHTDVRVQLDRAAGKILSLAF